MSSKCNGQKESELHRAGIQTKKKILCVRDREKSEAWPVREESGFIDGFYLFVLVVTTIGFDLVLDIMCMSECTSFEG